LCSAGSVQDEDERDEDGDDADPGADDHRTMPCLRTERIQPVLLNVASLVCKWFSLRCHVSSAVVTTWTPVW
jgi:hypothetical protein